MFELKPISHEGVGAAIKKAEIYRLLNEPRLAESICRDILEVEAENQRALVTLLLSITDQFGPHSQNAARNARSIVPRLKGEYEQYYYTGIIAERQAKATLLSGYPGCRFDAYEWFREAMHDYEKAEAIRPPGNDDPLLRWNTCARIIMDTRLESRPPEDHHESMLE